MGYRFAPACPVCRVVANEPPPVAADTLSPGSHYAGPHIKRVVEGPKGLWPNSTL